MSTYLTRRGATYYFRRVIPEELRAAFSGKRELTYSLKTKDRAEGARRCRAEAVRTDALFDAARKGAGSSPRHTPPNLPPRDVASRTSAALTRLRTERDHAAAAGTLDEFWADARERLAIWQTSLAHGPLTLEGETVAEALAKAEVGRNAYRALLTGEGAMLAASPEPASKPAADGPLLSALIEKWAAERKPTAKSLEMWRRTCELFYGVVGPLTVDAITKRHVLEFKDHLIQAGKSGATIANRLNQLRALFRYAVANDIIAADPSSGIKVAQNRSSRAARTYYGADELRALFGGPIHARGERPKRCAGEAGYWLPLLALYTGARLNELGQLRPRDVTSDVYRDANDRLCSASVVRFVEDPADGLTLKDPSSARRIPLHKTLIDLGFLRYVEAQRACGQTRIFPELKPDRFGTATGNWSKWYSHYLRNVCQITDRQIVFHSFRHSFKHYARECDIAKAVHDAFTGHVSGDVADDYGGLEYPLRPLVEAIAKYRIPDFKPPPAPSL